MSKYVLVVNTPNQIATVHLLSCGSLGASPLQNTGNATRKDFEDGLDAIAAASNAMPKSFKLCSLCLCRFNDLRIAKIENELKGKIMAHAATANCTVSIRC